MFQWSKKVVKSVTFNPGVADESLVALVESQLEKDPEKTFSDLCKEALWQFLCVPESVRPSPSPNPNPSPSPPPLPPLPPSTVPTIKAAAGGLEQQITELQSQMFDLEQRFFAKESNRLDMMERQLTQLSQQVAQLAIMVNQSHVIHSLPQSAPAPEVVNTTRSATTSNTTSAAVTPSHEVDPVISRLSQYLDDF